MEGITFSDVSSSPKFKKTCASQILNVLPEGEEEELLQHELMFV